MKKILVILVFLLISIFAREPISAGEIHNAIRKGNLEKVKLIITQNPKMVNSRNKEGMTPVRLAAMLGLDNIVKYLREHGAYYTIYDAAAMGDIKTVKAFIIKKPKLVSKKDKTGAYPLHYAVSKGKASVVKLLLSKKANINAGNKMGLSPLHIAALWKQPEIAEILIKNGADVNKKGKYNITPLHAAAGTAQREIVILLIKAGANIHAKDLQGYTPLVFAVRKNDEKTAELLRKYGAKQ